MRRIFASWGGGRSKAIDDQEAGRQGDRQSMPSCLLVSMQQTTGASAPVVCAHGGTLEHPEELTDRCCLSALAGLSKYLPLLGAGGIIAFWSDMSTLRFGVLRTLDHVYKEEKKDHSSRSPCGFVDKATHGAYRRTRSAFRICGVVSTSSATRYSSHRSGRNSHMILNEKRVTYPHSDAVIHIRSPLIHIFMLSEAARNL